MLRAFRRLPAAPALWSTVRLGTTSKKMLLPPMGLRFGLSATQITELAATIEAELNAASERIAGLGESERTDWDLTIKQWHERQGWAATMQTQCTTPALVPKRICKGLLTWRTPGEHRCGGAQGGQCRVRFIA